MTQQGCLCDALDAEAGGEGASGNGTLGNGAPYGRFPWDESVPKAPTADDGGAPHLEPLARLGLPGLLDAHSHWFPDNVEAKIWSYFDRHYWKVAYRFPSPKRLEWMRKNGVRRFTTLNYAHRPAMASWLNEWTARFAGEIPEAIPCGTFFAEPEAGADVRRCIEEYGFRGFKLHLRVSDMDPTHRLLAPAFEQLEQAGLPVVIHAGSAPDRGRFTAPGLIRELTARHPGLKVVVAHMGSAEYEDYFTMAERQEQLYLDTTMVFVGFLALGRYPQRLLERLEGISHKVLFGSDFPMIPYPLAHAVEGVLALPLSGTAQRRILGENAATLFGSSLE